LGVATCLDAVDLFIRHSSRSGVGVLKSKTDKDTLEDTDIRAFMANACEEQY
jgi:hypothetical protein